MLLPLDSFPSSAAFDAINSSLQSDDAERKDAIKKGNAVFAFALKNKEGSIESWYIDLKEKGEVAKGDAPAGKKADGQCPKSEVPDPAFLRRIMDLLLLLWLSEWLVKTFLD